MDRRACTVCAMTPTETDPAAAIAAAALNLAAQIRRRQLAGLRKIILGLTETEFDMLRSVAAQYPAADPARLMVEAYRVGVDAGRDLELMNQAGCAEAVDENPDRGV